jgi:hypothetical protein
MTAEFSNASRCMSAPTRSISRNLQKRPSRRSRRSPSRALPALLFLVTVSGTLAILTIRQHYTVSLQTPLRVHLQSPIVITARASSDETAAAQADQLGRHLSAYQQYACNKFGSACRVALAIQRAENAKGSCEIYHYNSDGTLDWGYFQINTVHLKRAGVNLRDLLDCRTNIDFAYELYRERGFAPWSTFRDGSYRRFLRN